MKSNFDAQRLADVHKLRKSFWLGARVDPEKFSEGAIVNFLQHMYLKECGGLSK